MENKIQSKKAKTGSLKKSSEAPLPQNDLWRSLYTLSQHWQSDIEFFKDELNFFRLLIDKHLALLIEPKNIEQTRMMVADVINLEKERVKLSQEVTRHLQHITALVENPFAQNSHSYKDEHEKLESAVAAFFRKFRSVKTEVFKLTERVIHSDKVKKMIDWA